MKQLILGGARSGKSRLAEQRASASGLEVVYIATAEAGDEEMACRIEHHRANRPLHWQLVEEPRHLRAALEKYAAPDRCLLVDCLTLWLTNLLLSEAVSVQAEVDALCDCIVALPGELVMVSNEVGWGIVPMGELSRRFQDEAGRLHQQLAARCHRVTLTVAGLPLEIKG